MTVSAIEQQSIVSASTKATTSGHIFHMIKVTLACFGKYIRGSAVETIWVENEILGQNVPESVLNGSNFDPY